MTDGPPLRLLVVHCTDEREQRLTVSEHLNAFRRYGEDVRVHHWNAFHGTPGWLAHVEVDAVIYHYTFVAQKWTVSDWRRFLPRSASLARVDAYKVAIAQDEYVHSELVCDFLRDHGVDTVVTCLPPEECRKVYPEAHSGVKRFVTVAPGYVDESALSWVGPASRGGARPIDVGYRARKVPYWLGSHGQLKGDLAERFLPVAGGLVADISTRPEDVFYGNEWYRFLLRCRATLGCEGGASLHDPKGEVRARVDAWVAANPDGTFAECEAACFPGLDGNLRLFAISPRHFEAAMTRTCQVLVEGDYMGILRPDVHYIPVKRDWSDLREAAERLRDAEACAAMAERTWEDLVASGRYTYRRFARTILDHIREHGAPRPRTTRGAALEPLLAAHEALEPRLRQHQALLRDFRGELLLDDGSIHWYAVAARLHGTAQRVGRAASRLLRRRS